MHASLLGLGVQCHPTVLGRHPGPHLTQVSLQQRASGTNPLGSRPVLVLLSVRAYVPESVLSSLSTAPPDTHSPPDRY